MALFEVLDIDRKFYKERLEEFLPDSMFDTHTHIYEEKKSESKATQKSVSWPSLVASCNPLEDMDETGRLLFPGKRYVPLMFASGVREDTQTMRNEYVSKVSAISGYPALYYTHQDQTGEEVERQVIAGGFRGIKMYYSCLPSYIPSAEIRIFDYLPHSHLEVCDKHGWTVMLHIPRPKRLRDPVNVAQLLEIERRYKNLKLIVAHVGRAYCKTDVGDALDILSKTENMIFDFSANTNSWVFEQLIKAVGPTRIMYGSDMPITRMRMRRIERDGIYVNLIKRGMYGDVSNDPNMGELDSPEADELTFFIYEEIEAFRQAAIRTGLSRSDIERVFWKNGADMFGLK